MSRTELRLSIIMLWIEIVLANAVNFFTANRHISFILQSIERRDLITICFEPPWGVEIRWDDLSTLPEKKIESKIP